MTGVAYVVCYSNQDGSIAVVDICGNGAGDENIRSGREQAIYLANKYQKDWDSYSGAMDTALNFGVPVSYVRSRVYYVYKIDILERVRTSRYMVRPQDNISQVEEDNNG